MPALDFLRGVGRNLLVFFGALYAHARLRRALLVLCPGRALARTLTAGFVMLWIVPVLDRGRRARVRAH